MGHRANLVIVNESGYELYYCHWCAISIHQYMFWGPEVALAYIGQQQAVDAEADWLDFVWAEGVVLVDKTKRHILLEVNVDDLNYIPLRHLYLNLMRQVWQGWTIQWATNGLLDVVSYLNIPREKVWQDRPYDDEDVVKFVEPTELQFQSMIGCIRRIDGTYGLLPFDGRIEDMIAYGASFASVMSQKATLTTYTLDDLSHDGFHIDEQHQTLHYWSPFGAEMWVEEVASRWPGLTIKSVGDDYEAIRQMTDNHLKIQEPTEDELLARLEDILIHGDYDHALKFFRWVLDHHDDIDVNPKALRDQPLDIDADFRPKAFDDAVKKWRASRGE